MGKFKGKSTIGLRDVCYAMLTEAADSFTYGTVNQVAGAIDAKITPNAEVTSQYADDGVFDTYAALGDIQITLEMAALPTEVQKDWLGFRVDSNGVLIKDKDAQGGYFALGFRALRGDGTFMYVWVYKCKASLPEESAHTKEGNSVTYTTRSLSLTASPRDKDGRWQAVANEGDEGVTPAVLAGFLTQVYEEGAEP